MINLLLNISLLFALLIAPSILMVSLWYRKDQGKPVFIWPKPEMVILTIVFFVVSLSLFIVGVSCFFTHFGYLDPGKFSGIASNQFLNLGTSCMLLIAGLSTVYYALRRLLVQMVKEGGLVLNKGLLPFPNSLFVMEWKNIVDYYIVPDYPNVSFTFITNNIDKELAYDRKSVKVPIYLKEDFQAFLDKKIYATQSDSSSDSDSEISPNRFFNEN